MSDYQILAFKHQLGLITLRENDKYLLEGSNAEGAPLTRILKDLLSCPSLYSIYSIYSVKHLPSGKIFTIGEHIKNFTYGYNGMNGVIEEFSLTGHNLFVHTTWSCIGFSLYGWEHVIPQEEKKAPESEFIAKLPLLGIISRDNAETAYMRGRIEDIIHGICRYNDKGERFPTEWSDELVDLINEL